MTEQPQNGNGDSTQDTNDTVPVVNLLDDKPSDNDDTGGGHKRVAEAIARLIERERGGKAIALEGSWGSGKSSVVRMLEKAFGHIGEKARKTNKKKDRGPEDRTNHGEDLPTDYLVYVFDAWKHEGDPLRVAFLRGLVTDLHVKGWLTQQHFDKWTVTFDELTSAIRTERTNRRARLRPQDILAITCLLAAVPAIPLWVKFKDDITDWSPAWVLANSLFILASIPMVVALLEYLRARLLGVPREEADKPRGFFRALKWKARHKQGIVELLLTRQPHEHITTFAGAPTITTEIFERKYRELMQTLLTDWPERRLVLVVDNLDRLDHEDAMAVWSTMRTFVEIDPDRSEWAGRMWMLVPYDSKQMGRLWDDTTTAAGDEPMLFHDRPSSFLDKTFAVRFDVPPLLLANWEMALGRYLREALGTDLTVEEIEGVVGLSRHYAAARKHAITPRHLKIFVNNIGALVRQYNDAFPIDSLAAYTILRRGGMTPEEIRGALRNDRAELTKHIPNDWPTRERMWDLACLVFNTTDREAAMELLLIGPVTQSIRDGDADGLARLLKAPGAVSIIQDWLPTVGDNLKNVPVPAVRSCLKRLQALGLERHFPNAPSKTLWAHVLQGLTDCLSAACETWHNSEDLPSLCRDFMAASPSGQTYSRMAGRLRSFNLEETDGTGPKQLAEAWSILWSEGGEEAKQACIAEKVPIPHETNDCAEFLSQLWTLRDTSRGLWGSLFETADGTVLGAVLPAPSTTNWPESVFSALNVLWGGACDFINWDKVGERLEQYLDTCNGDEHNTLLGILALFRGDNLTRANALHSAQDARSEATHSFHVLRKVVAHNGRWHHVFSTALKASNWELAAAAVAEIGSVQDLADEGAATAAVLAAKPELNELRKLPASSPELINAIAHLPISALADFLRNRIASAGAALLVSTVLNEMEPDVVRQTMPVDWVLEHWPQIATLDSEAQGIVRRLLDAHDFISSRNANPRYETATSVRVTNASLDSGSSSSTAGFRATIHISDLIVPTSCVVIYNSAEPATADLLVGDFDQPKSDSINIVDRHGAVLNVSHVAQRTEAVTFMRTGRFLAKVNATNEPTLATALRNLATTFPNDERVTFYSVFGELICEAMLAAPRPSDVPSIVTPAVNDTQFAEPAWLPDFLTDERAPGVVAVAKGADRESLLGTIKEKADAEGNDGGPYTVFLERCRAEGLVPAKEPEAPDDAPPA